MRSTILRFGRPAFTTVVLAALVFGLGQAVATARGNECSLCEYPDPQDECNTCCVVVLGFSYGVCFPSNTCFCAD